MYNSLASIGKNCERLSDDYLEYRRRLGNPFAYDKPETSLYVRFVSDDTVHRKGFNFSFIAYSDFGEYVKQFQASNAPQFDKFTIT